MKKVLYYVILAAIFIAFGFIISIGYSLAGLKPGGIHFNALLIIALVITGGLSKYVKKWLGIEEKKEEKKEGSSN